MTAIFTSDDLGHQHGPMMSPEIFRELYFPLYQEIIGYTHERGMHFWLHSCGDNTLLMDDLIEAGLDVFHPVQKGCMDEQETVRRFGGRLPSWRERRTISDAQRFRRSGTAGNTADEEAV